MNRIRRDWIELLTQRSVIATLLITSAMILILVFWIATLEKEVSDLRVELKETTRNTNDMRKQLFQDM